ncbi:putative membrane protein, partial [Escherichia coli 96.0428]
FPVRNLPGW